MKVRFEDDSIDLKDTDFVRLASYLAAAGKTWRNKKTGLLHTLVRSQFRSVVYPLFRKFYPHIRCAIVVSSKEKNGRTIDDLAFRIDDQKVLQHMEEVGFLLGSTRRRPPPYIVNDAKLFPIYLRIIWEVHGEVREGGDLPVVCLVQKFPQELSQLMNLLIFAGIECALVDDGKNYMLEIKSKEAIESFFNLMEWKADWRFGELKLNKILQYFRKRD